MKDTLFRVRREQIQVARAAAEGTREILSSYVFCAPGGGFLRHLNRLWYPALKRAALQDLRFHDLRHTFFSRLAMAGADLLTIKALAGHKTLAMTIRYSHLSPSHQWQAVKRLIGGATSTRTDTANKEADHSTPALIG